MKLITKIVFFLVFSFLGYAFIFDDGEEAKKKPIEKAWKLICIINKEKKRISWPQKEHYLEFRKDSLVRVILDINFCNGIYRQIDSTRLAINVKNCSIECCDGFTALNFADAFPDTFDYKLFADTLELHSLRYSILLRQ